MALPVRTIPSLSNPGHSSPSHCSSIAFLKSLPCRILTRRHHIVGLGHRLLYFWGDRAAGCRTVGASPAPCQVHQNRFGRGLPSTSSADRPDLAHSLNTSICCPWLIILIFSTCLLMPNCLQEAPAGSATGPGSRVAMVVREETIVGSPCMWPSPDAARNHSS